MQPWEFEESAANRRSERVSSTLKRELGLLITRTLKDPRLGQLTSVTNVNATRDLAKATVEVSVLGGSAEQDLTIQALTSASSKLRESLKSRVRMRRIPELHFELDRSIERGSELLTLMDEVAKQDKEIHRQRDEFRHGTPGDAT